MNEDNVIRWKEIKKRRKERKNKTKKVTKKNE